MDDKDYILTAYSKAEDTNCGNTGHWEYKYDPLFTKFTAYDGLQTEYYKGHLCHRLEGPACIYKKGHPGYPNGRQMWFIDGEQIPVSSQEEFEKYLKMKAFW